jgi:hypothetical protein
MAMGPRTVISDPIVDEIAIRLTGGNKIIYPANQRLTWTNSRLVVFPDGSTMPVLWLLAKEKHIGWDTDEWYPTWKDKELSWTWESLDNVQLLQKVRPRTKRSSNTTGFRAGSREYFQAYHAKPENKEKARQRAREYYIRQREERKADLELRAENARLRALLGEIQPDASRPSLDDIIQSYQPVGGGSSTPDEGTPVPAVPTAPLVRQIGTPMEDD